jgi:hypothetical protein
MNRFALIIMSALTLVLSACGTTEIPLTDIPLEEDVTLEPQQLELAIPELEQPGCSLPVLYLGDAEPSEVLQDCIFWGCIRYEVNALE